MPLATRRSLILLVILSAPIAGCDKSTPPSSASSTASSVQHDLEPTAGVQDIMAYMVDPAADFLWESVSTTVSATGTDEKQPRTDAEWTEVHKQALMLTEASNLLLMEGRRVAREGRSLEDHGTPGNLTAAESEHAIQTDRASFVAFAKALREVGKSMLIAAEQKSPQQILDAGDTMDQVCEGCHLKFWYPGQKIPPLPDQIPQLK